MKNEKIIKFGLSVVIPIFNEQKNIEGTINQLKEFSLSLKDNCEIIFVDDGSTDNSKKILELNLKEFNNSKLINNKFNLGYGAAIKKGINLSKFDTIAITDADSTYPIDRINEFYLYLKKNNLNMLIGDRSKSINYSLLSLFSFKNIARSIIRIVTSFMTGVNIKDINSGFRVFQKKIYDQFYFFLPDGFSFTSSLTCLSINSGHNIEYLDIKYDKRKGSSKIRFFDFFNFLNLILKIIIFTKPIRVFIPIFLFFFISGLILLSIRFFFMPKFFMTGLLSIILSFIFLFFGYVFELILISMKKNK